MAFEFDGPNASNWFTSPAAQPLVDDPPAPVYPHPQTGPSGKPDPRALLPWIDKDLGKAPLGDPRLGRPLGTDPGDPEIADKAIKYGLDPLGKAIGIAEPIAERVAPMLARETGEVLEHVSGALGPVGVGISLLGAGNESRKLVQTVAEDGPNAIHDQRFYNATAGVASNSTHALLGAGSLIPSPAAPFLKGADAVLSAAELTTDGLGLMSGLMFGEKGSFDSNSVEGGLLRGTMGDKSTGYQAGEWTRDKLGPGVGSAIASTGVKALVDQVAMPYDLARTVYNGVSDYASGITEAVNNGEGLIGYQKTHGLNGMGLPADNPILMALGLGNTVGTHPAKVAAGLGGGIGNLGGLAAEGVGGGGGHRAGAGIGGSIGVTGRVGAGLRGEAGGSLGAGIGGGVSTSASKVRSW
jgi:hypothetical protein